MFSRSRTSTTTGPGFSVPWSSGLLTSCSAENRRETPIEKPVAGTGSLRNRPTSPS